MGGCVGELTAAIFLFYTWLYSGKVYGMMLFIYICPPVSCTCFTFCIFFNSQRKNFYKACNRWRRRKVSVWQFTWWGHHALWISVFDIFIASYRSSSHCALIQELLPLLTDRHILGTLFSSPYICISSELKQFNCIVLSVCIMSVWQIQHATLLTQVCTKD